MGVAKGAAVVAVRVLNCEGSGTNAAVVAGMDYVVQMKRDAHPSAPTVMSMSLGGSRSSESYDDPSLDPKYASVQAAKALGVSVVVAAGNSGVDVDTRSPAHIDDAITVAASNVNKQRSLMTPSQLRLRMSTSSAHISHASGEVLTSSRLVTR